MIQLFTLMILFIFAEQIKNIFGIYGELNFSNNNNNNHVNVHFHKRELNIQMFLLSPQ